MLQLLRELMLIYGSFFQHVPSPRANKQASLWQVPSVNMSYKPIYLLSAQQHTRSKTRSLAYTHICILYMNTQIPGRCSLLRQTSKARAWGVNRKQSASSQWVWKFKLWRCFFIFQHSVLLSLTNSIFSHFPSAPVSASLTMCSCSCYWRKS